MAIARNIINTVRKARLLGDMTWLRPSGHTNTVFFDFESYGYDPKERSINEWQDPFEIGMSVWNAVKKDWVHRSFKFTPQGLSGGLNFERANPDKVMNNREEVLGHTFDTWMGERSAFTQKARPDTYKRDIRPLFASIGDKKHADYKAVPWDEIDEWLGENGIDGTKALHTITHNGNRFDHAMLDKLIATGGQDSYFGKAFTEMPAANKHDTAATWNQIYGGQGRGMRSHPKNGTRTDGSKAGAPITYVRMAYNPEFNQQPYPGTAMDNIRHTMVSIYNEKNTNKFASMFHDTPEALQRRTKLFEDLGVSEHMIGEDIPEHGAGLMGHFFENVGHIGHGDTAVGALMVLDMLARELEVDHSNWKEMADHHSGNPFFHRLVEDGRVPKANGYGTEKKWDAYTIEPRNFHAEMIAENSATKYEDDDLGHAHQIKELRARQLARAAKAERDAAKAAQGGEGGVTPSTGGSDSRWGGTQAQLDLATPKDMKPAPKSATVSTGTVADANTPPATGTAAKGEFTPSESISADEDELDDDEVPTQTAHQITMIEDFNNNQSMLTKDIFPKAIQDLIGDRAIDVFRVSGVDTLSSDKSGRPVVVIPLGNARVAFRASNFKDGQTYNETKRFTPNLGFASVESRYRADSDGDPVIEMQGVDEYLKELFGSPRGDGPLTHIHQMIEKVLLNPNTQNQISQYLGSEEDGKPTLDPTAANVRINTPASHWLNESIGKPIKSSDIMPEGYDDYRTKAFDALKPFMEEDRLPEDMNTLVSILLSDPLSGSSSFKGLEMLDPKTRELKEDWFDVKTPEGVRHMQELYGAFRDAGMEAAPSNDPKIMDSFEYDADKPQLVGMNLRDLFSQYIKGEMPEGVHPKQFINDSEGKDSSLSDQFINYLLLKHQNTNLNYNVEDILENMNYASPLNLDNTLHMPNIRGMIEAAGSSDPEVARAAAEAFADYGDVSDPTTPTNVTDNINIKTYNKSTSYFALPYWMRNNPSISASEYEAKIREMEDSYGYPFTSRHNIKGVQADYTDEEATEELFPARVPGQTNEEVLSLIEQARENYAQDPTSMLREMEWIRDNHSEWISQESMQEALRNDDRKSVVGKWVDTVKFASDNGADFAYVEEEKDKMKDKFMSASHIEWIKKNPHQKVDMVENPPFEAPKSNSKQPTTLGEKARQLAEGAWRNSGYYQTWRNVRNRKKNAIGEKALEAARSKDVGSIRDLGITTQTQFMEHIGDLPVEGEEQRGLLGLMLQGKKTFNDLARERNKSTDRKKNVADTLRELRQIEHDRIQSRVPNRDITAAERKTASAAADIGIAAHEEFAAKLREQREAGKATSGSGQAGATAPPSGATAPPSGATAPPPFSAKVDPTTAKDDYIDTDFSKKSKDKLSALEVLKEYIASV